MKLLMLILLLTLTSCTQNIALWKVKAAESYCETRSGIESLYFVPFNGWMVSCGNGKIVELNRLRGK